MSKFIVKAEGVCTNKIKANQSHQKQAINQLIKSHNSINIKPNQFNESIQMKSTQLNRRVWFAPRNVTQGCVCSNHALVVHQRVQLLAGQRLLWLVCMVAVCLPM